MLFIIVHTGTPPVAKRRKIERTGPLEIAPSSKPLSKTKRSGLSRRVQGRLQNMLLLPLDVLFLVYPYQLELSSSLLNNFSSDILGARAYGSPEPHAHEQSLAASSNVTQVYVGLDTCATGCWGNEGS
jgi:hypothetical protein